MRNSILWQNDRDLIAVPSNLPPTLTNVWYCDISSGANNGRSGCFNANPLFADTTFFREQSKHGNYAGGYFPGGYWTNAAANSPVLDAGDPSSPYVREPTPNGRRANLGAYGNTAEASQSPFRAGSLLIIR